MIRTFLSHIWPSGLVILFVWVLRVVVKHEQTCTIGALHALDHLAWGWYQLKAKSLNVLNEQQIICLSVLWNSSEPFELLSHASILSHPDFLSLCILHNIYAWVILGISGIWKFIFQTVINLAKFLAKMSMIITAIIPPLLTLAPWTAQQQCKHSYLYCIAQGCQGKLA